MMALLPTKAEKPQLADDFATWAAAFTWTWKPQKEVPAVTKLSDKDGAARGDRQDPEPPTPMTARQAYLKLIQTHSASSPLKPSPFSSLSTSFSSFSTAPSSNSHSPSPSQHTVLFTTKYFEARPSPKGGFGAFATENIPEGTVILSEKALFRAAFQEVFTAYEGLSFDQRKLYRTLYGWPGIDKYKILAIYKTNRFECGRGERGGIFIKSSRFNHACHPYASCTYGWDPDKKRLITTSLRHIEEGEEITISYGGSSQILHEQYGFWCQCPKCPDAKTARKEAKFFRGD